MPSARRIQRRAARQRLAESQNWRCAYCGVVMQLEREPLATAATIDHVISLNAHGPKEWDNQVAACHDCNSHRRSMNAFKFWRIINEKRKVPLGKKGHRVYNGVLAYLEKKAQQGVKSGSKSPTRTKSDIIIP